MMSFLDDFFAIRITEDPVYGTPVFTTLGGHTNCPGETGTQMSESRTRIVYIIPRCGKTRSDGCDEKTLIPGQKARFGIVIENLAPYGEVGYFTLLFEKAFDSYQKHGYTASGIGACGTPGMRAGLQATFSEKQLREIPYNLWIEVPFAVGSSTDIDDCYIFNDVGIKLVSTCEYGNPTLPPNDVYQYGLVLNPKDGTYSINYDDVRVEPFNSVATFSVTFPKVTGLNRRQLDVSGKSASSTFNQELKENWELGNSDKMAKIEQMLAAQQQMMTTSIVIVVSLMLFMAGGGAYLSWSLMKSVTSNTGERRHGQFLA